MSTVLKNQNEVTDYGYSSEQVAAYNDAINSYENGNTLLVKKIIEQGTLPLLKFMDYVCYFCDPQSDSYCDLSSTHNIQCLVKEVLDKI